MIKRKEGWYRVLTNSMYPMLMLWDGDKWVVDTLNGDLVFYKDNQLGDIDPKMVMSHVGKIVYRR